MLPTASSESSLASRSGFLGPDLLLAVGALGGFTGVAMGAFGAHGLKATLSAEWMAVFQTAVQYQVWHSLALLVIATLWRCSAASRWLMWAAASMLLGVSLFSGSLYALSLTEARWLGFITPFGGILLLLGWLLLAADRILAVKREV